MLKVCVAPTRTCPVSPPLPGLSMAMPWSTSFRARTAKPRNSSPASVVHDLLADPVEQRLADLFLELADLVRQRRLGDVHPRRRPGEAQMLGDGDEVAKMPQLHGNPAVESMPSIISMRKRHFLGPAAQP